MLMCKKIEKNMRKYAKGWERMFSVAIFAVQMLFFPFAVFFFVWGVGVCGCVGVSLSIACCYQIYT